MAEALVGSSTAHWACFGQGLSHGATEGFLLGRSPGAGGELLGFRDRHLLQGLQSLPSSGRVSQSGLPLPWTVPSWPGFQEWAAGALVCT